MTCCRYPRETLPSVEHWRICLRGYCSTSVADWMVCWFLLDYMSELESVKTHTVEKGGTVNRTLEPTPEERLRLRWLYVLAAPGTILLQILT